MTSPRAACRCAGSPTRAPSWQIDSCVIERTVIGKARSQTTRHLIMLVADLAKTLPERIGVAANQRPCTPSGHSSASLWLSLCAQYHTLESSYLTQWRGVCLTGSVFTTTYPRREFRQRIHKISSMVSHGEHLVLFELSRQVWISWKNPRCIIMFASSLHTCPGHDRLISQSSITHRRKSGPTI